jgi:hypothetical protein
MGLAGVCRIFAAACVCSVGLMVLAIGTARADSLYVAESTQTIPASGPQGEMLAGESTSAVVPASRKSQCPQGRFLATLDGLRPESTGVVRGRDLGDPNAGVVEATLSGLPDPMHHRFGSNDHDLVVLPNGDLLLAFGGFSDAPLEPKPVWFDTAFRGDFGPGARSILDVWRSEDCGGTFNFVGEFDPARELDGSCAYPNLPVIPTPAGQDAGRTYYDMGGSDGQKIRVDQQGIVYLTFQCVGYAPGPTVNGQFRLDTAKALSKTMVATSVDRGSTWSTLGFFSLPGQYNGWRQDIVAASNQMVLLAQGLALRVGTRDPLGNLSIPADGKQIPTSASWGYGNFLNKSDIAYAHDHLIAAWFWASTVASSVGQDALVAFPTVLPMSNGKEVYGYQVFTYEPATSRWSRLPGCSALRD